MITRRTLVASLAATPALAIGAAAGEATTLSPEIEAAFFAWREAWLGYEALAADISEAGEDLADDPLLHEFGKRENVAVRALCRAQAQTVCDLLAKAAVAAHWEGYDKSSIDGVLDFYFEQSSPFNGEILMLSMLRDLLAGHVAGMPPVPIVEAADPASELGLERPQASALVPLDTDQKMWKRCQ